MKFKTRPFSNQGMSILLALAILLICGLKTYSQEAKSSLETEIYTLENGLTIYLNEDHTLPSVFGAVAVKGGSKRDPADATGIAHYFEHIMFKGTDSIGTLDYQAEKVFLDSIAVYYDQLDAAATPEERLKIQEDINRISLKASAFAIPNEFGKIIDGMGGTMVNAGTSNESIVYFNVFPSNQAEKWLRVYSHRFIHPVYRLFQSELETVYEEYNMYKDDRFSNAFEVYSQALFPDYPYGVPVIGYPDDLKNPSMKKMDEYFDTYYVANNMALVLSGNFNSEEVKPLIEQYFGKWRSGEIPPLPAEYKIEPFEGRMVLEEKLTPIKFGIRSYRSVPIGHEDEPVLDVMNSILSNGSSTGLLDDLTVENKLMQAAVGSMRFIDAGTEIVIFVPKVVGQSLKKAENLIAEQLENIKAGKFGDDLLEAVKTQYIVNYERRFEDQYSRGYMMISAFTEQRGWPDVINYPDKIERITKEDVVKAAQKYYGPDYMVFYSETGFPKKPEALKPPFEPIPSVNTDQRSKYAQAIESMTIPEAAPEFIEYGPPGNPSNEVTVVDLNPLAHLYYVDNTVNDLFNLDISFGIGTYEMPILAQVAEYMNLVGTEEMTLKELSGKLQKLGASYRFYASKDEFNVNISGLDTHLDEILDIVAGLIYSPKADAAKIDNLVESAKATEKVETEDPETLGYALYMYATFGERSPFINRLSGKDIKALKTDALHQALHQAIQVEADIHYSGTTGLTELEATLAQKLRLITISVKSNSPARNDFNVYEEPVVFFLDDKKAIQSKNYFFVPGEIVRQEEKPFKNAYMEYLDGGMQSIIFQEIREFRSLAYATGAFIQGAYYPDERTSLSAYVGTQADKTKEAVEVMYKILSALPEKSDRLEMVKKSLIQSINSSKPGFRRISHTAANFINQGYISDPRIVWVEAYKAMSFDDIIRYYNKQYFNKLSVITIIGDKSKIDLDWLENYGKVIEVKKEDLFR
jgi:predicted Zn-dependent peptidase